VEIPDKARRLSGVSQEEIMRNLLVFALAVVWACSVVGCGEGGAGKTDTEKNFQELYKQYSARFYEKTTNQAQAMPPMQVTQEASRIWDEVFSPNKALVTKRVEEILKELDQCPAIQEDQYSEVAVGTYEASAPADKAWKTVVAGKQTREDSMPDEAEGLVLKQFRWSPLGDAQMALNNWLQRIMQPPAFAMRQVMSVNVSPVWEVVDRSVDHPKLCLRQGPMVFLVDVSHKNDCYQIEKIRWLRPKSMGPVSVPIAGKAPPAGEAPAIATPPPVGIPGATSPVTPIPPATTTEKPKG
jgi:hypothetical protein